MALGVQRVGPAELRGDHCWNFGDTVGPPGAAQLGNVGLAGRGAQPVLQPRASVSLWVPPGQPPGWLSSQ